MQSNTLTDYALKKIPRKLISDYLVQGQTKWYEQTSDESKFLMK